MGLPNVLLNYCQHSIGRFLSGWEQVSSWMFVCHIRRWTPFMDDEEEVSRQLAGGVLLTRADRASAEEIFWHYCNARFKRAGIRTCRGFCGGFTQI